MKGTHFDRMPLAVIGMSCRLPGAENLDQYWQVLIEGRNCITELPAHRLDTELFYNPEKGVPGKTYSKRCGIIPDRPFDHSAYPISDNLFQDSDPMHLTTLETAGEACKHAGFDPFDLPSKNTGVYIGHARSSLFSGDIGYATHTEEIIEFLKETDEFKRLPDPIQQAVARNVVADIHRKKPSRFDSRGLHTFSNAASAIVCEAFGLNGPYMSLDAACASSLYALQMAAGALFHKRIDMAIVGGASFSSWPSLILFSQAQALSATGSFPFDERADGFISSDGYAAILIQPLENALRDGNRVLGIIRGLGISNDGRGKSLWAPRKEGQIQAITRAYSDRMNPAYLQHIEAHGTSTQLGDATELEALATVLTPLLHPGTRIPVSSSKANIGHTCETAGMVGLIKTLLCMAHETIPPAIHFVHPNPKIDWDHIPFFVPTAQMEWPVHSDGHPRCAAVDSFGIGGLNAHLVLEQYMANKSTVGFTPETEPTETNPMPPAVAVIGMGTVFPGARTVAAYRELIRSGRDPKSDVSPKRWNPDLYVETQTRKARRSPTKRGGFITDFNYDWEKHKIPPKQLETGDILHFMLLDAVEQALTGAGYDRKPFDRHRTGVVVGTIFSNDFALQLNLALHLPELEQDIKNELRRQEVSEALIPDILNRFRESYLKINTTMDDQTGSYSCSTLASRVAKTYDFMGGAFALDAGEASSMAALSGAVDLLRTGQCDMVCCAGAQRAMDIYLYELYSRMDLLSTGEPGRPFDANTNGFVPGEGTGVLLLKRLDDAQKDGDTVYAVIRGIGTATQMNGSDALQTYAIHPAIHGAVANALAISGVNPAEVLLVETAGIGVNRIDQDEAAALADAYGVTQRAQPLHIGTLIGQIGHTLGASGMASLIKTILSLQHGEMPPNFQSQQPGSTIIDPATPLHLLSQPVPIPDLSPNGASRSLAGVTALAFRGSAYHVILESERPRRPQEVDQIFRLGGENIPEMGRRLNRMTENSGDWQGASLTSPYHPQDTARLAVIYQDAADLKQKIQLAASQLGRPESSHVLFEKGIFYQTVSPGFTPRLAFVFSGLGSQYTGMLRELVRDVPAAAEKLKEIDALMTQFGYPTFSEIAWQENPGLNTDVWMTQMAMLLSDTILYAVLQDKGIRPSVVCGHSYGEFPALVAAGAWSLEQAIRITNLRGRSIQQCQTARGGLLSTTAPRAEIDRLAEALKGHIYLANHNAPDQVVVGGDHSSLSALEAILSDHGFENKILPVPSPFHTPLMADVQVYLREGLEKEKFLPPRIPVLSSVTNRYTADPEEIRENLGKQLTQPVLYMDLIQRLVNDDTRVIVEVGPRQVLTRLNHRILKGMGNAEVSAISSDNPKRPGKNRLVYVQALLECHGLWTERNDRPLQPETQPETHPKETTDNGALSPNAIIHYDATQNRKEKRRRVGRGEDHGESAVPEERPLSPENTGNQPPDEIESFLIRFICDQTGYPPEIVDLDSDLEADLGIDSIKKAQLMGELREHMKITINPSGNFNLGSFQTLRHIIAFLKENAGDGKIEPPSPPRIDEENTAPVKPVEEKDELDILTCQGTPYDMGLQHARSQKENIDRILKEYGACLGIAPEKLTDYIAQLPISDAYFDSDSLEELRGLADGTGQPLEILMAYNLGLYPDYIPSGCAHFAVRGECNGDQGLIHGANEDWPLAFKLKDSLTHAVHFRQPSGKTPYVLFSLSGQVGGLNGVNRHGLAVSSTLLLDRPILKMEPTGYIHPVLVRHILSQAENIEDAIDIVKNSRRLGAWTLCISHHPTDRMVYIEYDGDSIRMDSNPDIVTTTNHCLLHDPRGEVPEHSILRFKRLESLLKLNKNEDEGNQNGGARGCTLEKARRILRDKFDLSRNRETPHATMNTIRRVDNQLSIIMRPGFGEVWVTPGPRKKTPDHFYRLDLKAFFDPKPWIDSRPHGSENLGNLMNRYVLRMIEPPVETTCLAQDHAALFHGAVSILGKNPMAHALAQYIKKLGVTVLEIPGPASGTPDQIVPLVEAAWKIEFSPHLFVMTGFDEDASGVGMDGGLAWREDAGMLLPYRVCQQWIKGVYQSGLQDKATLVAVTGSGGDFGFSGGGRSAEDGGITGLVKAIRREYRDLLVKAIDFPREESPERAAFAVCGELARSENRTDPLEVGIVRGTRRIVRAVPRLAACRQRRAIQPDGAWVITGGGRGITGFVARELGIRFGLTLHLIGSSPLMKIDDTLSGLSEKEFKALKTSAIRAGRSNGTDVTADWEKIEKSIEIKNNLDRCSEQGVNAHYHACDVSDPTALDALLQQIRQSDGPIRGIIHGAGVERAAQFERKTMANVRATLNAKVLGAAHLMALTRNDLLDYFIGFGSVSGRFGGLGQTDYSMASDMLAKLIQLFRTQRPECASVCVHWPAWDEIGMCMRPESRLALEAAHQPLMNPGEGVTHLIDELRAGAPEGEIVIMGRPGDLDIDGILPQPTLIPEYRDRESAIDRYSLIDGVCDIREGQRELHLMAEARLDPATDPFLLEHRFDGLPILPAVIGMEAMAQAAALLQPARTVTGLRDVQIINGLRFFSNHPQNIRISAGMDQRGHACEATLSGDFYNRQGAVVEPNRRYIQAQVLWNENEAGQTEPSVQVAWQPQPEEVFDTIYMDETKAKEDKLVWHGPRLRYLKKIALHAQGGWGLIQAPPLTEIGGNRPGKTWLIPAAVLDACLVACGIFDIKVLDKHHLPLGFGQVKLFRLPDEGDMCTLCFRFRGWDEENKTTGFDLTLYGTDGKPILDVENHRCVVLNKKQ